MLVDNELFKRSQEGLLLKCVDNSEARSIMHKVHEGICRAHKSGLKMRWLIHRYRFYWPTISTNYLAYAKGCEPYQINGLLQIMPTKKLHAIIKPWPFRG